MAIIDPLGKEIPETITNDLNLELNLSEHREENGGVLTIANDGITVEPIYERTFDVSLDEVAERLETETAAIYLVLDFTDLKREADERFACGWRTGELFLFAYTDAAKASDDFDPAKYITKILPEIFAVWNRNEDGFIYEPANTTENGGRFTIGESEYLTFWPYEPIQGSAEKRENFYYVRTGVSFELLLKNQ